MGQDETEVVQALLDATIIHNDIIEIYYYILIKHIEEDLVHEPLEGWRGISEAKQHHYPFENTIYRQKSATTLVLRGDPDLMVPHG